MRQAIAEKGKDQRLEVKPKHDEGDTIKHNKSQQA